MNKKEKIQELKNYEHNVHAGIMAGFIVAITFMAYNLILENTKNTIFAVIVGIITITLLYYFWVIRVITKKKKEWGLK